MLITENGITDRLVRHVDWDRLEDLLDRSGYGVDDVMAGYGDMSTPSVDSNRTHVQVIGGRMDHVRHQMARWDEHMRTRDNYHEVDVRTVVDDSGRNGCVVIVYTMGDVRRMVQSPRRTWKMPHGTVLTTSARR